jgi:molecular chaperone DnaJ
VQIPPGVDSGHRLRLEGLGDAGLRGAPSGDLYVIIHVLPHKIFERRGTEIACEVSLPFTIAALGGKIKVPTLGEEEELHIPPGTQTGTIFRLRGKGLPTIDGHSAGDEHVVVKVTVPTKLNTHQKHLLRQLAEEEGETAVDDKGLLERVKDVLGGP